MDALFLLVVPMVETLLHHKYPLPYTDKLRGLYSPPFDTVTEDLWSIIILYIDSRFLYTQKELKK